MILTLTALLYIDSVQKLNAAMPTLILDYTEGISHTLYLTVYVIYYQVIKLSYVRNKIIFYDSYSEKSLMHRLCIDLYGATLTLIFDCTEGYLVLYMSCYVSYIVKLSSCLIQ